MDIEIKKLTQELENDYMDIEIKKLTPEMTNDYIDYFDNIAFTDN